MAARRNDAFLALTTTVAPELLTPPVNVARLLLHPRGLAPRIVNIDEWARHIPDRLTAESVQNPDNQLTELLTELKLEAFLPADERSAALLAELGAASASDTEA